MAEYPKDLKYSTQHEWVRVEGSEATIGITAYAQDELGDVVYVDLPQVGREVKAGESLAVVESVKAVSDIYAPVSGRVVRVNEELASQPEWINEEPYGKGWVAVLEMADPAELDSLLDADGYREHVEAE